MNRSSQAGQQDIEQWLDFTDFKSQFQIPMRVVVGLLKPSEPATYNVCMKVIPATAEPGSLMALRLLTVFELMTGRESTNAFVGMA